MTARWLAGRAFQTVVGALTLTGAMITTAPGVATASTCVSVTGVQPHQDGMFAGVAVLSRCNAWAVGNDNNGAEFVTVIEHWNGTAWKRVSSPNPATGFPGNFLQGVAATSSSNAWAVGYVRNSTLENIDELTLIEHWNGRAWKHVPSPNPAGSGNANRLFGVAARSSSNAWAVGIYHIGTMNHTLIVHWNGRAWKHVRSPNPAGSDNGLFGVAATSSGSAWAVGASSSRTLILHWNGTAWKRQRSPNPAGSDDFLSAVSAISARNAWAVGSYTSGNVQRTLIEHWNGRAWNRVPSPNPSSSGNALLGVTAISATDAWAVGSTDQGGVEQTLIVHWNGRAWKRVSSPDVGGTAELDGVAAASATNIWAVGRVDASALALHCC